MADCTERQKPFDQRKISQQAGTAIAADHFFHRTSEVDVDMVEAEILAIARGIGHHLGIRAEKLCGDGMFIRIEVQIAECARRPGRFTVGFRGRDYAVRAGELGHDETASALGPDQAAEYRIGHAHHRRQHGRGLDMRASDVESAREHYSSILAS